MSKDHVRIYVEITAELLQLKAELQTPENQRILEIRRLESELADEQASHGFTIGERDTARDQLEDARTEITALHSRIFYLETLLGLCAPTCPQVTDSELEVEA